MCERSSRVKSGSLLCSYFGFPGDIEVHVESAPLCKSPSLEESMAVCPRSLESASNECGGHFWISWNLMHKEQLKKVLKNYPHKKSHVRTVTSVLRRVEWIHGTRTLKQCRWLCSTALLEPSILLRLVGGIDLHWNWCCLECWFFCEKKEKETMGCWFHLFICTKPECWGLEPESPAWEAGTLPDGLYGLHGISSSDLQH